MVVGPQVGEVAAENRPPRAEAPQSRPPLQPPQLLLILRCFYRLRYRVQSPP